MYCSVQKMQMHYYFWKKSKIRVGWLKIISSNLTNSFKFENLTKKKIIFEIFQKTFGQPWLFWSYIQHMCKYLKVWIIWKLDSWIRVVILMYFVVVFCMTMISMLQLRAIWFLTVTKDLFFLVVYWKKKLCEVFVLLKKFLRNKWKVVYTYFELCQFYFKSKGFFLVNGYLISSGLFGKWSDLYFLILNVFLFLVILSVYQRTFWLSQVDTTLPKLATIQLLGPGWQIFLHTFKKDH